MSGYVDASARLDSPLLTEWYAKDFGETNNRTSLCPEAPPNPAVRPSSDPHYQFGTVASAWVQNGYSASQDNNVFETRASSYACNGTLIEAAYLAPLHATVNVSSAFLSEDQIVQPAATPLLADAVSHIALPSTNDLPSTDLVNGLPNPMNTGGLYAMGSLTIPRHGSRPNPVPTNWPVNRRLPGAINVACFDGHAETLKLERLWQLYWTPDWVTPLKRPGLQ